ncbi:MAG: tRNA-binding protein [Thermaerobacter sp.]|nr:tRNA-binding protein [Thermaerobacter sp.]
MSEPPARVTPDTMADTAPIEGFLCYRLGVGTVRAARMNPKARNPAYHLIIDFGPFGVRESSAQITERYDPEDLIGRQVVAVLNLPPRWVAGVRSEVLVLGAMLSASEVVLLSLDTAVPDGTVIG